MKLVALNGLLGYGYSQLSLENAFLDPPDFVGVDGGSSDPGPYYLGSGHSFTNRSAVKRDLALVLPLALKAGAPLVVGTSGGSGSEKHLHWLRDIVLEIAQEENLAFQMALIYTDVEKATVLEKFAAGKIHDMGPLSVTKKDIADSNCIVSQIGAEPFLEALRSGAQVVLAGRACDTAIYAAPCLLHGFDPGLSFHMAKIMECGAMCATPVAAADVMQAWMEKDHFPPALWASFWTPWQKPRTSPTRSWPWQERDCSTSTTPAARVPPATWPSPTPPRIFTWGQYTPSAFIT